MAEKIRKKQITAEVSDEFWQRLKRASQQIEKKQAEFIRDAVREKMDEILNLNQKPIEQSV